MEGTTSIAQLPADNVYSSENIVLETNDVRPQQPQMQPQGQMQGQMQQQPPQGQMQGQMQQQQQPQGQMQQQQQPQMQPQQPQMQQGQMQDQQQPNVGGGAASFSRPSSPQINYNNNNDPSLVQHLAGIQETNMLNNGMALPSRDIPTNTNHFSQDQQTNPNWVPQDQQTNYINNQVSQDMINQFSHQQNNILNNNDVIYDQLKVPIIISILFFIYNFNSFDKSLLNQFPFLFTQDQHLKKSGMFIKSLLFGAGYFAINKGIDHFSKI
uniref:Uncharacterized protein n=1 Tax=viral metagenome TaxID=1070528 RepID=A0A6C0BYJ6_9ZZZZ